MKYLRVQIFFRVDTFVTQFCNKNALQQSPEFLTAPVAKVQDFLSTFPLKQIEYEVVWKLMSDSLYLEVDMMCPLVCLPVISEALLLPPQQISTVGFQPPLSVYSK